MTCPRAVTILRKVTPWLLVYGMVSGLVTGCAEPKKPSPTAHPAKDAADAEWEAGIGRAPTARTLLAMGRALQVQGKTAEAEFVFTRITHQEPTFLPAYVNLADLLMHQRRTGPAIDILSAGLKVAPKDPVLRNDLGMAYLAEGKHAQALTAFEQACASDPKNSRYIANRAVALAMLGRYDDAYAAYRRILSPADAHHNLSLLCRARHDGEQANRESSLVDGPSPVNNPSQTNMPARVTALPANRGD